MRTWLDSVNEHQKTVTACNNTTRDHSYNWCIHGEECINITIPSISSIVRHVNELGLYPNFPRTCWYFWRDCPTF